MHNKTLFVALAAAGLAFGAQAAKVAYPDSQIRESTDRAKIAAVERHAAALGAPVGGAMSGSGTSAAGDSGAMDKPMHKKGAKHHAAKKSGKKASKGQTGDQAGNAPKGS
jgi:hypothetical protein